MKYRTGNLLRSLCAGVQIRTMNAYTLTTAIQLMDVLTMPTIKYMLHGLSARLM
jgi:hypothetical protein